MTTKTTSTNNHFRGAILFKVHVNFDIPLFKIKIDADVLEKWFNLLEGYYSIQKKLDIKNITFALLKALPHVQYWWESYEERHDGDESTNFRIESTWEVFVDAIKEEFYLVGNYND
jgi:hypothetical protein